MRLLLKQLILLVVVIGGCNRGKDFIRVIREPGQVEGITLECIEGHAYYRSGGIAPKLHDDGKPVKCSDSKDEEMRETPEVQSP